MECLDDVCKWEVEDDSMFSTTCGYKFPCDLAWVAEEFNFCPYCGKNIYFTSNKIIVIFV